MLVFVFGGDSNGNNLCVLCSDLLHLDAATGTFEILSAGAAFKAVLPQIEKADTQRLIAPNWGFCNNA